MPPVALHSSALKGRFGVATAALAPGELVIADWPLAASVLPLDMPPDLAQLYTLFCAAEIPAAELAEYDYMLKSPALDNASTTATASSTSSKQGQQQQQGPPQSRNSRRADAPLGSEPPFAQNFLLLSFLCPHPQCRRVHVVDIPMHRYLTATLMAPCDDTQSQQQYQPQQCGRVTVGGGAAVQPLSASQRAQYRPSAAVSPLWALAPCLPVLPLLLPVLPAAAAALRQAALLLVDPGYAHMMGGALLAANVHAFVTHNKPDNNKPDNKPESNKTDHNKPGSKSQSTAGEPETGASCNTVSASALEQLRRDWSCAEYDPTSTSPEDMFVKPHPYTLPPYPQPTYSDRVCASAPNATSPCTDAVTNTSATAAATGSATTTTTTTTTATAIAVKPVRLPSPWSALRLAADPSPQSARARRAYVSVARTAVGALPATAAAAAAAGAAEALAAALAATAQPTCGPGGALPAPALASAPVTLAAALAVLCTVADTNTLSAPLATALLAPYQAAWAPFSEREQRLSDREQRLSDREQGLQWHTVPLGLSTVASEFPFISDALKNALKNDPSNSSRVRDSDDGCEDDDEDEDNDSGSDSDAEGHRGTELASDCERAIRYMRSQGYTLRLRIAPPSQQQLQQHADSGGNGSGSGSGTDGNEEAQWRLLPLPGDAVMPRIAMLEHSCAPVCDARTVTLPTVTRTVPTVTPSAHSAQNVRLWSDVALGRVVERLCPLATVAVMAASAIKEGQVRSTI